MTYDLIRKNDYNCDYTLDNWLSLFCQSIFSQCICLLSLPSDAWLLFFILFGAFMSTSLPNFTTIIFILYALSRLTYSSCIWQLTCHTSTSHSDESLPSPTSTQRTPLSPWQCWAIVAPLVHSCPPLASHSDEHLCLQHWSNALLQPHGIGGLWRHR